MSPVDSEARHDSSFSARVKLTIVIGLILLAIIFVLQIRSILSPFLWALLAAYLLTPLVNYLNVWGGLNRLWAVALIYALIGIGLVAASRYLYPRVVEQGGLFLEDIPRLQASLETAVGTHPLGIDLDALVKQFFSAQSGYTSNARNAGNLLANVAAVVVKVFLFLVATFYLLVDAPRLKGTIVSTLPPAYRDELVALGSRINVTWQQYIRGELLLFAIMSFATTIGLLILQVPGAIFLGLTSGALELLPLVGPYTAGAIAVSVGYFNGTNPWGWSQFAYGGVIALMYFVFREIEDYFVIPNVLGRAVRLHPLVVLFAVTTGGIIGGLFGLIIAVPVAASLKEISTYLYAKLLDLPIEFEPIKTLGGGVIEIPVHGNTRHNTENSATEGTGAS